MRIACKDVLLPEHRRIDPSATGIIQCGGRGGTLASGTICVVKLVPAQRPPAPSSYGNRATGGDGVSPAKCHTDAVHSHRAKPCSCATPRELESCRHTLPAPVRPGGRRRVRRQASVTLPAKCIEVLLRVSAGQIEQFGAGRQSLIVTGVEERYTAHAAGSISGCSS